MRGSTTKLLLTTLHGSVIYCGKGGKNGLGGVYGWGSDTVEPCLRWWRTPVLVKLWGTKESRALLRYFQNPPVPALDSSGQTHRLSGQED